MNERTYIEVKLEGDYANLGRSRVACALAPVLIADHGGHITVNDSGDVLYFNGGVSSVDPLSDYQAMVNKALGG